MKSILIRTGSGPVLNRFTPVDSSPKKTMMMTRQNSVESLSNYGEKLAGKKISMRRVLSDSDVIRSERMLKSFGSKSSPTKIPEDEEEDVFRFSNDWGSSIWMEEEEEEGFSGGNGGGGGSGFNGGNGDGGDDRSKIGEYYREMLKSDPNNSLLLMNYGKFLYEVVKDGEGAMEYYGRAILASPGDGEALCMYGKLIWETKRDEKRAQCYFDQALNASPNDCMVLGSYAHFMWEAEDDEEDEEEFMAASPAMVSAA